MTTTEPMLSKKFEICSRCAERGFPGVKITFKQNGRWDNGKIRWKLFNFEDDSEHFHKSAAAGGNGNGNGKSSKSEEDYERERQERQQAIKSQHDENIQTDKEMIAAIKEQTAMLGRLVFVLSEVADGLKHKK